LQSPKPQLDQTNTVKAIGMMQTFINTHPGSPRNVQADIINKCVAKLEIKEMEAAKLWLIWVSTRQPYRLYQPDQ
jgi:outer membrane protein assembly factor BamD